MQNACVGVGAEAEAELSLLLLHHLIVGGTIAGGACTRTRVAASPMSSYRDMRMDGMTAVRDAIACNDCGDGCWLLPAAILE